MKKSCTTLCLMMLLFVHGNAQQVGMRVWTGAEASTLYLFSTKPVVVFTPTEIKVTANNTEFSIGKHDYVKLSFEESENENAIVSISDSPYVSFNKGVISLSNLPADSPISVYSLNGTLVQQSKASGNGGANVNLNGQTSGVYIIRSSAGVFKVLKK